MHRFFENNDNMKKLVVISSILLLIFCFNTNAQDIGAIYKYGNTNLDLQELLFNNSNGQLNLSNLSSQYLSTENQFGFYNIQNILFVDDSPTIFSTILVPAYLFPGMTKATLLKGSSTLYSVYQKSFGITITRSSEQLVASTADALTVKNLKLKKGDSIIEINRLAYTFGGTLIEKRNSKVNTKLFYYEINEGEL